jgi:hypothetical protein
LVWQANGIAKGVQEVAVQQFFVTDRVLDQVLVRHGNGCENRESVNACGA